jgi:ABC-type thiamine transport system ATPase subunit
MAHFKTAAGCHNAAQSKQTGALLRAYSTSQPLQLLDAAAAAAASLLQQEALPLARFAQGSQCTEATLPAT